MPKSYKLNLKNMQMKNTNNPFKNDEQELWTGRNHDEKENFD